MSSPINWMRYLDGVISGPTRQDCGEVPKLFARNAAHFRVQNTKFWPQDSIKFDGLLLRDQLFKFIDNTLRVLSPLPTSESDVWISRARTFTGFLILHFNSSCRKKKQK
jgi:hypothetical protein